MSNSVIRNHRTKSLSAHNAAESGLIAGSSTRSLSDPIPPLRPQIAAANPDWVRPNPLPAIAIAQALTSVGVIAAFFRICLIDYASRDSANW